MPTLCYRNDDYCFTDSKAKHTAIKLVFKSLIEGAKSAVSVAIPCACIGIVVGVVLMTGVGLEFSSLMRSMSGGALFPLLLIMMVASLVLGLGVPTTAAYILVSVLAVPRMIGMGVPAMAAHLFCFYFAVISVITPPVALAAYTAAGIAKADPFETGGPRYDLVLRGSSYLLFLSISRDFYWSVRRQRF
jgi:TRAP-type uncharacterized transport system fused permease subunit